MDRLPKKTNGKQPLGIKAYEKIHEKIITLEYKPGQSLEEKQLMRHLGLGRTPIREALMRLVGERVLESQPGKGFMVRQITLQNTRAVFEMMKILETGAAELAICQDTDAFIPEMERAAQEVKAAVDTMNILRLVQANHDFHLNFARCARNEYLIRWINETRNEAKRLSTKWDMHLNYPAGNFHSQGAQRFADRVAEATGGELTIVLHPGTALGFKGPELLRAVAEGQLAIAEVPTGMVEGDAPVLALTAQPFISSNAFEQRLLYQLSKPTYGKVLKKFNQLTLYTSVWPFSGIYTQREIKSVADLKGLKMRVYDGTGLAFGAATGIAARKMPFSEVYPAMKAGLLDSMYTSSVSGVDAKAWEVLKYFTPINIVGPVNMVNVNQAAWEKLSPEIQTTVLEIAEQMEDEMWNLAGDMDRKSRATLVENGMNVAPVSQAFRKELDAIGEQLRGEWAKKAGADAQGILDGYSKITGK
jgi:TRAP-type C4-dicarboxylate transport system substrate-binding protein/DNA-binding transcriptional regulator YhcF (GntR family)